MLDPVTVKLLGKLKISAKKAGADIDLTKIADDLIYAERILKEFSNSVDHELAAIAIKLLHHLGLLDLNLDISGV